MNKMLLSLTVTIVLISSMIIVNSGLIYANNDIMLKEPQLNSTVDLLQALKLRESSRKFSNDEVSIQDLSTVLWAANGINREDGKRTAPSAYGKYIIEIYVLADQGVYCYEPEQNRLKFISNTKLKGKAGTQGDIKTAFYVLLLTAKLN